MSSILGSIVKFQFLLTFAQVQYVKLKRYCLFLFTDCCFKIFFQALYTAKNLISYL